MREMIQTERDYVRSLEYIIEVKNVTKDHNYQFIFLFSYWCESSRQLPL